MAAKEISCKQIIKFIYFIDARTAVNGSVCAAPRHVHVDRLSDKWYFRLDPGADHATVKGLHANLHFVKEIRFSIFLWYRKDTHLFSVSLNDIRTRTIIFNYTFYVL